MFLWGEKGQNAVRFWLYLSVVGIVCLGGCASKQDVDALRYEVYSTQSNFVQENKALKQELVVLKKQIKDLKVQLEKTSTPVRATQANLWAEVESLRVQVASLSGKIDTILREQAATQNATNNATKSVDELTHKVEALEGKLTALSSRLGIDLEESLDKPQDQAIKKKPIIEPDNPEDLYKKALDSFYKRKYDLAQTLWDEFVREYPKHKLVPNAYFWQGECFFQMEDYKRAILAYQKVIERFPKSSKIAPSLLKQAISFAKIKKNKAAILLLKDVIKKFPKTIEARRAKAFLSKLEGAK
ncbi:tol-pal system protein YbgF [Desulfonauticus submarinus]|uniref:Tol-pal system protein YbgF n=1 Tax=Desulfonauticus submarinus TaxID=206665 RepID=A0A1H0DXJ3_9BACT|nr:tol-pal system protein YbgF [Desulfonauticus submarinus]SDN74987.1 tol-pal system protein YbgF [Desulfonauticus submarinus]